MPRKPKRPCAKPGCPALVDPSTGRYCPSHVHIQTERQRESWAALDARKTPEARAFYGSASWQRARNLHIKQEPLCRPCRARGRITPADIVHHEPSREELIARGDSPLDQRWLVSVCRRCHMRIEREAHRKTGGKK